jgi:hypothetical protein
VGHPGATIGPGAVSAAQAESEFLRVWLAAQYPAGEAVQAHLTRGGTVMLIESDSNGSKTTV